MAATKPTGCSSEYTGHVEPGQGAARRVLADLMIEKASVGRMDNNAYLLTCRHTGERLLIDAAAQPDRLLAMLGDDTLAAVLTTHRHADHWMALDDIVVTTGASHLAHALDAPYLPVEADVELADGDQLRLGRSTLRVIELGGHTPGSIAVAYQEPGGSAHIFTGDGLFPGGIGSTGSPQDFATLFSAVRTRLFEVFADTTWIYPGHGDDTTLGAERPALPEWAARGW